jgi:23S rRNA pseudouridine955/2504/2580 synthase/23S rRNA pseudouridine1911/1915/1917 synthase
MESAIVNGVEPAAWKLRFRVSRDKAGVALLDFLAARFPFFSAREWEQRVASGRVLVNGVSVAPSLVLSFRDFIEYAGWDVPEPDAPMLLDIVHDDADLLVVNKPAGLPCHPGGRYLRHTVWAVLRERHGVASPVLVNRLDRETSGLMLVARSADAAGRCQRQFAGRKVFKRYAALVEGVFPARLDAAGLIAPDPASPVLKRRLFLPLPPPGTPAPEGAREAETLFTLEAVHGDVSDVRAVPRTGRLHQIRATLSASGYPVVGDKLYGPDPTVFLRFCDGRMTDADRERLRLDRQALHSERLAFRHPATGRDVEFSAPLPADMAGLIRRLDAAGTGRRPDSGETA